METNFGKKGHKTKQKSQLLQKYDVLLRNFTFIIC